MGYRAIGSVLIVASCGGYGLLLTAGYRHLERELQRLMEILTYMESQLAYQLTPLPDLCSQAGRMAGGTVGEVFRNLARELHWQSACDVDGCMKIALQRSRDLPSELSTLLMRLGSTLGRFDLPGQLRGLENVKENCRIKLETLGTGREVRLRSYRTLSLCAGTALVILLL